MAREKKTMHAEPRASQEPRWQHGEIEQHRARYRCGCQSKRKLWLEAMRSDVLMTNMLEDLTIRHRRGAGRFTGEATHTFSGVKVRPFILRQSSCRFLTPQTQSPTR
jgi:hypothetical protein